jgi:hypothetical protein
LERDAHGELVFLTPDGRVIADLPELVPVSLPGIDAVLARNDANGLSIDHEVNALESYTPHPYYGWCASELVG